MQFTSPSPTQSLPSLTHPERIAILNALFEPSKALQTLFAKDLAAQSYNSYFELIAHIGAQLRDLSESGDEGSLRLLEEILGSHPRLGKKEVESLQSRAEQAQLQSGGKGEDELGQLNTLYENVFPGLRYIVFVNGREHAAIAGEMKARISRGEIHLERQAAITAMCNIAMDRVRKLGNGEINQWNHAHRVSESTPD